VNRYLRTGQVEKLVTVPGYEVIEQRFDVQQYAEATRPPIPALSLRSAGQLCRSRAELGRAHRSGRM